MSNLTTEDSDTEELDMEEESTIEDYIENRKPDSKDGKIVAFLGESGCGKTVVSALLKHALTKHFIPKNAKKWDAVPSSGYEYINSVILEMKKGNFPDPTLENEHPKLIIDVYNMEGIPAKIKLVLRDISGENYTNLLSTEQFDFEQQMTTLLEHAEKNEHLVFAKTYVILVDCAQKEFWDTDPSNITSMISKLRRFKQKIHHLEEDKKMDSPIAIVFTKADRLENEDKDKSAEELMKEYPGLKSSLDINQDGARGFFKVYVSSRLETKKEAEQRVNEIEEQLQKKFSLKRNALKTTTDIAIDKAVTNAEKKARSEGADEGKIQEAKEAAKKSVLEQYKASLDETMPKLENKEKLLTPKWVVKIPLEYSDLEYNKFISWILEKTLK